MAFVLRPNLRALMRLSRGRLFLVIASSVCLGLLILHEFSIMGQRNFIHRYVRYLSDADARQQESIMPYEWDGHFHNFKYFYYLALGQMRQSMYWFDRLETELPLMRMSSREESAEYRVHHGTRWAAASTLAVVATARNAMPGLRSTVNNLRRLCDYFAACHLVFLENDSTDDTRSYLHNLAGADPRVTLIGCGTINSDAPCHLNITYSTRKMHQPGYQQIRSLVEQIDRGIIMSALRNQLLAYVYASLGSKPTVLLSVDPDIKWHDWQIPNILQGLYYFGAKPQLDSLCASSYYNNYGLPTVHDPCTLVFFNNQHFGSNNYQQVKLDVAVGSCRYPIKVSSCFQGMTFYRYESLYKRRLLYRRSHGEWLCEHNTISRQLEENYIDPNMKLLVI